MRWLCSLAVKTQLKGVLSVSLAGLEEVWSVVLQRAAQVHHSSEEQQQQQTPGAAAPALAGRGGATECEQQPLLHLGQGER